MFVPMMIWLALFGVEIVITEVERFFTFVKLSTVTVVSVVPLETVYSPLYALVMVLEPSVRTSTLENGSTVPVFVPSTLLRVKSVF